MFYRKDKNRNVLKNIDYDLEATYKFNYLLCRDSCLFQHKCQKGWGHLKDAVLFDGPKISSSPG